MPHDRAQHKSTLAESHAEKRSDLDHKWMQKALKLADKAASQGEVPVGAVIIGPDEKPLSSAYNRREMDQSPIAHAEVLAIKKAAQKLKKWRLEGCTLYVTLEPCVMCAGAIVQSRLKRVVIGAKDPKGGAVSSLYEVLSDKRLNHRPQVTEGVLQEACSHQLKEFFKELRKKPSAL